MKIVGLREVGDGGSCFKLPAMFLPNASRKESTFWSLKVQKYINPSESPEFHRWLKLCLQHSKPSPRRFVQSQLPILAIFGPQAIHSSIGPQRFATRRVHTVRADEDNAFDVEVAKKAPRTVRTAMTGAVALLAAQVHRDRVCSADRVGIVRCLLDDGVHPE